MFFNLIAPLADQIIAANLFRYLTFRAGAACITALILSLMFGPMMIRHLRAIQGQGQPIRPDGPERHLIEKKGTPTMGGVLIPLGVAVPLVAALVMVGFSNAVNLTDGLDGLAIVPTIIAAGVFALIAYLVGNRVFADYLQLNFVPGVGELAIFCSALIGAGLGFLWFNAPPAAVFMGDTGSLALGGALGAVAVAVKHEIVLAIVGGLFVVETVSVIIQVAWYKRTKRRVFLMAPLHHHFEKKGWSEPTIVIRFWIIAMILALIGLGTLKIR